LSINRPEFLRPAPLPRLNELANGKPVPCYMAAFFAEQPHMAALYRDGDLSHLDPETRAEIMRTFVEHMALAWAQNRVGEVLIEDIQAAIHPTHPPTNQAKAA